MSPEILNLVLALMEWVAELEARVHDMSEKLDHMLNLDFSRNSG